MTTKTEKTADLLRTVLADLALVVDGIAQDQLHQPFAMRRAGRRATAQPRARLADNIRSWVRRP